MRLCETARSVQTSRPHNQTSETNKLESFEFKRMHFLLFFFRELQANCKVFAGFGEEIWADSEAREQIAKVLAGQNV